METRNQYAIVHRNYDATGNKSKLIGVSVAATSSSVATIRKVLEDKMNYYIQNGYELKTSFQSHKSLLKNGLKITLTVEITTNYE